MNCAAFEAHRHCIVGIGGAAGGGKTGDGGGVGGGDVGGKLGVVRPRSGRRFGPGKGCNCCGALRREARPRPRTGGDERGTGLGDAGGVHSSDESDPGPDRTNVVSCVNSPSSPRRRKMSRPFRVFDVKTSFILVIV